MDTRTLAIFLPLLPLLGASLVGILGTRILKDRAHWPVLVGSGLSLLFAFLLLFRVETRAIKFDLYRWIHTGASWLSVSFQFDALTSLMLITVTLVAFLVVVYSVGYMRDHHGHAERGYERFFAFLGIFIFSMCTLVLAGNFVVLYLGWELVGLSSYLLIGFYYPKPEAAAAAKKAFIVNRIGDFGFGLGIFLIILTFGTADYSEVFQMVSRGVTDDGGALTNARITTIALLLFCGAMGKSAQLPLHVWLPDAMEGPTPVSALIHAATMVTAGIYMVARCHVIFGASDYAMWIVGSIGAITAIFAATIALTQFDMKRILAYSTLSQLGLMFLGLGVGAFDSAMFHLFTHAFFKALLFLGAGSVMHAMAGTIDIRRFSGLRESLPITYWTFVIGGLALAGFPLFSGFWSKDEIIHAALHSDMPWLGWIGILTAWLTAFYTFRMIFIAFHGPERLPRGVEHAHESGRWMWIPLVLLSFGAVVAGYMGVRFHAGGAFLMFEPHGRFHSFLEPVFADLHRVQHISGAAHASGQGQYWLMYVSGLIAIWGIATAAYFYLRRPVIPMAIALASGPVYQLLYHKYYVDELYEKLFVEPLRRLGRFCYGMDQYFINAILWIISAVPRAIGYFLKTWQQGAIQGYALGMVVGLLVMVWWMIGR